MTTVLSAVTQAVNQTTCHSSAVILCPAYRRTINASSSPELLPGPDSILSIELIFGFVASRWATAFHTRGADSMPKPLLCFTVIGIASWSVMSLADVRLISFDCYGTLVDWETGITNAMQGVLRARGIQIRDEQILAAYSRMEPALQAETYQPYREVLRGVVQQFGREFGFRPTV